MVDGRLIGRREFIGAAACFAVSGCWTLKTSSAEARLAAGSAEARRQLANGAMRGVALGTDGAMAAYGLRHSGFTGQTIFADPETGIAAVVLTSRNCPHKEGLSNRNRIINRLIGG